jgi:hypothetical protein
MRSADEQHESAVVSIDAMAGLCRRSNGVWANPAHGRGVGAGIRSSDLLGGVALVGVGLGMTVGGVALLRGSELLLGVASIAIGMAAIGLGVADLRQANLLSGAAGIGFGVATLGYGTVVVSKEPNVVAWLRSLVADPAEKDNRSPDD